MASLVGELLEDLYVRRDEILEELKEASGVRYLDLQEALTAIDRALIDPAKLSGSVMTGDALIDEWEAAISRGENPDLEKGRQKPSKVKSRLSLVIPQRGSGKKV